MLEPITDTSSESQIDASADDPQNDTYSLGEDIGLLDRLSGDVVYKAPLRSWETYQDQSHREPVSAYFSESGAKGFDAALAHHAGKHKVISSERLVRSDVFFQALCRLGLGWSSVFFRYNQQERRFERALDDFRVSGVSLPVLNKTIDEMLQCGTDMQRTRAFVRRNHVKTAELSALYTFSSAVAVVVYVVERQLSSQSKQAVSLLQIKSSFGRGGELASALANMVDAVEKATSDAQVMSVVMGKAAYLTQRFG